MRRGGYCVLLVASILTLAAASPYAPWTLVTPAAGETWYDMTPTFRVYLLTPNTNPARQQMALVVMNNMQVIGIETERVIVGWDTIYTRALIPNSGIVGKIHTDGGYDALFIGRRLTWNADPYTFYHSSQFAPTGENYCLWNNTQNDQLVEKIRSEANYTKRLDYIKQWQVLAYDELPSIAICYSKEEVLTDPHLNATTFEKYWYPLWPNVELWQFNDSTSAATLAWSTLFTSLSLFHSTNNPPYYGAFQSPSYDDLCYSAPVYGEGSGFGLTRRSYDYDMTDYMAYSNWTVTPDSRNWTFWVKPGILFHNGEELDARDVVATHRAVMAPAYACPAYCYANAVLGGNTSIYFAGEAGTPGASLPYNKYEVHFDPAVAGGSLLLVDFASRSIYPASVLMNGTYDFASQGYMDMQPTVDTLASFRLTSFGAPTDLPYLYTMKNGSVKTYVGPMGAGPYTYVGYNGTSKIVHLQKNPNYFRKTALEGQGYLQLTDYYCRYISGLAGAVLALENGEADVLDPYWARLLRHALMPQPDESVCRYVSFEGLEVQELAFNMRHPIFGTGVGTPLGAGNASLAAEAAKHVRRAIEHLVPKHPIIMGLMEGFGSLGITMPVTRGMEGFNHDIVPRNDTANSQALAMQELRAAGYEFTPHLYGFPPEPFSYWPVIIVISPVPVVLLMYFASSRRRAGAARRPAAPLAKTSTSHLFQ